MSLSFDSGLAFARRSRQALLMGLLATVPWAAHAVPACEHEVSLVFTESAPRDLFEIRNGSSKGQSVQRVTLDLAGSAGRLLFDTVEGGTGVEVFQPFRTESGEAKLSKSPTVPDGSDRLELVFDRFDAGQRFRFSIDVDDRLTASDLGQIRVSGREMEGAVMTVVFGAPGASGVERTARVDGNNVARVKKAACS
jgi:hypothetical protein